MTIYRRVFLADDDADDRDLFIDALQEIDKTIYCYHATNGESALKVLSGDILEKPELIFLDLNMPKINGKGVLKTLKTSSELSDIPVIMYSTFFSPNDIKEITELGAHCLVKQTNFKDLCNALRAILNTAW
ncbi:MAG TPA: response regulator [Cyclobacteriaceae bacterium]|jgi:DNA-binding response OmpR family regulator|nr:response regulator [Cyclobacteriaceae bacterium]